MSKASCGAAWAAVAERIVMSAGAGRLDAGFRAGVGEVQALCVYVCVRACVHVCMYDVLQVV